MRGSEIIQSRLKPESERLPWRLGATCPRPHTARVPALGQPWVAIRCCRHSPLLAAPPVLWLFLSVSSSSLPLLFWFPISTACSIPFLPSFSALMTYTCLHSQSFWQAQRTKRRTGGGQWDFSQQWAVRES